MGTGVTTVASGPEKGKGSVAGVPRLGNPSALGYRGHLCSVEGLLLAMALVPLSPEL